MAVDLITQTWDSGLQSSMDDKGWVIRTATIAYQATVTDSVNDHEETVRAAMASQQGVVENALHPRFGIPYICRVVDVQKVTPVLYEVKATYKTPSLRDGDPGQYPWESPAVVNFYDITVNAEVDEDINGDPIVTANNEPINGVTRDYSDLGIQVTKGFLGFSPAAYYDYKDKVNSDFFLGMAPGLLRVVGLPATEQNFEGQKYYQVTANIAARVPRQTTYDKAWWFRHCHKGFKVRVGSNIVHATDDNKVDVTQPVLLSSTGTQVPDGGTPHFLEWELYESVAFSGMGFF